MKEAARTAPDTVLTALGIGPDALLGLGGEAWVYGLDEARVARIYRPGTTQRSVVGRTALLQEMAATQDRVSFALPTVLEMLEIDLYWVTIERRLAGRPLIDLLAKVSNPVRERLITGYLDAAAAIHRLGLGRPWYGDLFEGPNVIRTSSFRAYLAQRAGHSLAAAGGEFAHISAIALAEALPEPTMPALVHLDAFPGNMLAENGEITAVLDFGVVAIMGDARLDPVAAAVYLDPPITPTATEQDRQLAQEWLANQGLAHLYHPTRRWLAAFWSFAHDDPPLFAWCQAVLNNKP
ncbi:MAG: phosphotransferase [Chloroflexota bacterium]|jgi:Ser/Thr protein kinase RdoA (MazF antagonist)